MKKLALIFTLLFLASCVVSPPEQDTPPAQNTPPLLVNVEVSEYSLENILPYQSPYMGDNSNFINLFGSLPLAKSFDIKYHLLPDTFTAVVQYMPLSEVSADDRVAMIFYNATSAFALIDNLQVLQFEFPGITYEVDRKTLEGIFWTALNSLLEKEKWNTEVVERVKNKTFPADFYRSESMTQK